MSRLAIVLWMLLPACNGPAPVRGLHYGADPLQTLDVYPTWGEQRPVVVWVHGGGWCTGDKLDSSLAKKRALFADERWVFVSVNYRLSPSPSEVDNPDRVRHPDHIDDVVAALAWVDQHIAEYGGDPERVALMGASAGAHLVALAATDPARRAEAGVGACVVSLEAATYNLNVLYKARSVGDTTLRNAFGDVRDDWVDASPELHITPDAPPFLVTEREDASSAERADRFAGELRADGVPVTVVDVGVMTHDEVAASLGDDHDVRVTPPVMEFLKICLED